MLKLVFRRRMAFESIQQNCTCSLLQLASDPSMKQLFPKTEPRNQIVSRFLRGSVAEDNSRFPNHSTIDEKQISGYIDC
jgi:hypothetical protein